MIRPASHHTPDDSPRAASRPGGASDGLRTLLITPVLPWPAHHVGSAQRTELIRRALARHGEVDVLFLPGGDYPCIDQLMGDDLKGRYNVVQTFIWPADRFTGPWRYVAQIPGPLRRTAHMLARNRGKMSPDRHAACWLAHQCRHERYDLIVSRYMRPAVLAGAVGCPAPLILDIDDVDWLTMAREIEAHPWPGGWKGRVASRLAVMQMKRLCTHHLRRCDHVWSASDEDRNALMPVASTVLPNIPFAGEARRMTPLPHRPHSREVLFVGALSHEPNRDGLDRFITLVWPAVHAAVPDALLRIVGAGLVESDGRRWGRAPGVEVVGAIENLCDAYASAAITVAPIYHGGGTKIKVLESLALGRVPVVTPHALHGYASLLRHGESLWCGQTDAQLAEGCIATLTDPLTRQRMAQRGQAIVNVHYTFDALAAEVDRTLQRLLANFADH